MEIPPVVHAQMSFNQVKGISWWLIPFAAFVDEWDIDG